MKRYKVSVYNTAEKFWDEYEVNAVDPVDARNVAVQRLVTRPGTAWTSTRLPMYTKLKIEPA